jgi:predicted O-linked N-acetylglucosamine transferase (SPINDLY family)
MVTKPEALAQAIACHQAGNFTQAEQIYQQILRADPRNVDALHLSGVLAHQRGQDERALHLIGMAIQLNPREATFHCHLGLAQTALQQLAEAAASFRQALALRPDFAEAHNNLGNVFYQRGQWEEAVACYRRAVELRPDYPEAHKNSAVILMEQGRREEAIVHVRHAVRYRPNYAEARYQLGMLLADQGKLDEAVGHFRHAIMVQPAFFEAHHYLGIALGAQGFPDDAIVSFRQAIQLKPDVAETHHHLAKALRSLKRLDEAVASFRQALVLRPDFPEALHHLGATLVMQGKADEAEPFLLRAVELLPEDPLVHNSLAIALGMQGKMDEAIAGFQRVLQLKPDFPEVQSNLGIALKDQGKLTEALACYRRALKLRPDFAEAHGNLCYTLHFCAEVDARTIYEEHRRWNQLHAQPLAQFILPHLNDRSPERRLRIGYVAPDFRAHPVGWFLLPLLQQHDHEMFEVFCYASVVNPDVITERCRAQADVWRGVLGLSDEQLTAAIREDRIDILVDLTMHMGHSRLLVFARKPAPVQVTYLGYCSTTGLGAMDYRLTDPYLDPPERSEIVYSEQSVHLPLTYWCYQPGSPTAPVNELPALQTGHVTFGCLNNFCKVTGPTLAAWIRLLREMPEAHLLLHAKSGSHRDRVRDLLAEQDIAPERLAFVDTVSAEEYFRLYHGVDVGLDPFPYCGGTTTCDALWMGVPVVTLAGQTAVGRGGVSILSNVGVPELIASDVDQYIHLAQELAADLPRLGQLRATLRELMRGSPLMDAPQFARDIEAAYRGMWRRWCAGCCPAN